MPVVTAGTTIADRAPLEQSNLMATTRQMQGSRQTGQTATDHHDVGFSWFNQRRRGRALRTGAFPDGFGGLFGWLHGYTGRAVVLKTVRNANEDCICATPGRRAR